MFACCAAISAWDCWIRAAMPAAWRAVLSAASMAWPRPEVTRLSSWARMTSNRAALVARARSGVRPKKCREFAAPTTFNLASRFYSAMNLADRHRPIHNLVISNVPGPPFPLYLAGAEVIACAGTDAKAQLADLQALNLEVKRRFDAEQIEFAFPTQTVYHRPEPDWAGPRPA